MRKPIIYQVLPRLFGNKHTASVQWGSAVDNGVGKFSDLNDAALTGIRALGATHVWYTGVLEHATVTDYPEDNIPPDHPRVVKGRAGSPYAIRDYYDVAPDLANRVSERMKEFEALIARTHAHHLKVIIDFVPNHVARVYCSDAKPPGVSDLGHNDNTSVPFHPRNNFYYLSGQPFTPPADYDPPTMHTERWRNVPYEEMPAKVSGNNAFDAAPSVDAWFETVKLNYGIDIAQGGTQTFDPVPDTWRKMRDILLYWTNKEIDGFRCDMAEMVPIAFWAWVIPQVKAVRRDVVFIAEIYTPKLYRPFITEAGFDYLYDKVLLYDALRQIMHDQHGTIAIARIQRELRGLGNHMLHFMENHDEQRIASRFFAGNPWHAVPAMMVSAMVDGGPVLIYFGQETGEPAVGASGFSGDDGRTTIFDYWHVPTHQQWMNGGRFDGARLSEDQHRLRTYYQKLLHFASTEPALVSGEYFDLTAHHTHTDGGSSCVHAFIRFHGEDRLLIVTNFSDRVARATLQWTAEVFAAIGMESGGFRLRGIFGTQDAIGVADGEAVITLEPRSGHVYRVES